MQIFYLNIIDNDRASLEGDEAKHCIKVLRHKIGDKIHGIDGQGSKVAGTITKIEHHKVYLAINDCKENWGEHLYDIRLGVSLLRLRDRFEWIIEKAVELGVSEFVPIICKRTYKYPGKWKPERINKIILSATKQSKRSKIMSLALPTPMKDFIDLDHSNIKLMGYCEATTPLHTLQKEITIQKSISLLIGPEGDFTSEEVALAAEKQFHTLSFGENRLRTETAAIYAMSFIKASKGY